MSCWENFVNCHAKNISLRDFLGFCLQNPKTNQMGKNANSVWHVYGKPHHPITCPILVLAWYLFSNPGTLTPVLIDNEDADPNVKIDLIIPRRSLSNVSCICYIKLFPGQIQCGPFMKCFHMFVIENKEEFLHLGVEEGDLGSQSERKHSCCFASSRSTVSPPIFSVCLWAMWSIGTMKEWNFHYEKASNQYLGCVVNGVNSNGYLFASSPAYFYLKGLMINHSWGSHNQWFESIQISRRMWRLSS